MASEDSSAGSDGGDTAFIDIGTVAFVVGIFDANDRRKAQEKISKIEAKRFEIRRQAANKAFLLQAQRLRSKQGEQAAQISVQVDKIASEALKKRGQIAAAQGAGGVAGQSVQESLQELTRQESSILSRLSVFDRFRNAEIESNIKTARINATLTTLNALPAPNVIRPLGADILRAAGIALETGSTARDLFGQQGAKRSQTTTQTTTASDSLSDDESFF